MDKYAVTIINTEEERPITAIKGESLMEALTLNGVYMSAPCGGAGLCGKCKVQMLEGATEISTEDENVLSKKELDEGYRLSCRSFPESYCRIRLVNSDEESFDVVS
ncbi:MAG: 2Fe-2S iron-sulfur cluster-binding protein, partial [Agathobacter sp.]|nr:2Fe-2S iron-sulfur cluster-binding protein [Agathobacter sp.]